jgi:hypothetical protein
VFDELKSGAKESGRSKLVRLLLAFSEGGADGMEALALVVVSFISGTLLVSTDLDASDLSRLNFGEAGGVCSLTRGTSTSAPKFSLETLKDDLKNEEVVRLVKVPREVTSATEGMSSSSIEVMPSGLKSILSAGRAGNFFFLTGGGLEKTLR